MLLLKLSEQSFHIHFTGPIQNENIIAFDIMKFDKFNSTNPFYWIPLKMYEMQYTLLRILSFM